MKKDKDWIGVDLDRTLAVRKSGDSIYHIGAPIEPMCQRVREKLAEGYTVKIMTARVNPMHADAETQREMVRQWCKVHLGQELEVTCMKDHKMGELWDDLARRVIENTGHLCPGCAGETT